MKIYVVLFRNGDCFGCCKPLDEKQMKLVLDDAIKRGIDAIPIDMEKIFEHPYYKPERFFGDK